MNLLRNASAIFYPGKKSDEPHSGSPGVTSTHNPPNIIPLMSTDIPENILAFRTITTLLAQIPRATQLERKDYLENEITDGVNRQILKISDAFAHIAGGDMRCTGIDVKVRNTRIEGSSASGKILKTPNTHSHSHTHLSQSRYKSSGPLILRNITCVFKNLSIVLLYTDFMYLIANRSPKTLKTI